MPNLLTKLRLSSLGLICFFFSFHGIAQTIDLQADLQLIDAFSKEQMPKPVKRSYIFKNQPGTFKNRNPVSLLYGGALFVYQNFISQHFSADCLYDPSCSEFSKLAVREYGLLKGGLLTIDRLGRCNRIAATDLNMSSINTKTHRFSDDIKNYK